MRKGFTLAEVLITLGIIGIVAAMTLPGLIQNYQKKVIVNKLKKQLSIFSQAYLRAVEEYGTPDLWGINGFNDEEGAQHIYDKLSPFLAIIKDCGQNSGCWDENGYKYGKWRGGKIAVSSYKPYKFILNDGTLVYIQSRSADCSENGKKCAHIAVDINGKTSPNTLGEDVFIFNLNKNGIEARGGQDEPEGDSFSAECLNINGYGSGWSCAAWVIQMENLEYLKCNDLSWEGKHTCN